MSLPQKKYYNRILIILLLITLFPLSKIYSQESISHLIEANVKLAVCGDTLVEYGEECEPLVYEIMFCSDFGYEGDEVLCDNSCSYDFSQCIIPDPPPPPVVVDEPIFEETVEKYVPTIVVNDTYTTNTVNTATPYPYPFLEYFDLNGNGKIDSNEFAISVKLWGQYWKEYRVENKEYDSLKCDLNRDSRCDIVDLSILMYHSK